MNTTGNKVYLMNKEDFLRISQDDINFFDNSVDIIYFKKDATRQGLILLNMDRNYFTLHTIRYLVRTERVADIYTLSRTMFEGVINMGLITRKLIPDDADRYQAFPFIESYKHIII